MIQLGARRGSMQRQVRDLNMEKNDCLRVLCVRDRGGSKNHKQAKGAEGAATVVLFTQLITRLGAEAWMRHSVVLVHIVSN